MNDAIYPSLNKVYSAFVVVVGVLGGGFIAYSGVFNSADMLASILAVGIGLATVAGAVLIVYRASGLRLSDDGVSSRGIDFNWGDVTEIKRTGFGLHVIAGDKKIVIAPHAYENPDQLLDFVDKAVSRTS